MPEVKSMGYKICYGKERKGRLRAMTAGWFCVFLLLVGLCWPRGREALTQLLLPGDGAVTVAAMEAFAQELRTGEKLRDAAESFCRTVLEEQPLASG